MKPIPARPAARAAAAIIATAGLTLLAACSGSSSTGSGGSANAGGPANSPSANSQKALAFSRCVRARGVPNWPDPSPYPQDPVRPTFKLQAAGISFHPGTQPGNIVNSPQIEADRGG
jgi:hypothetical protein